MEGVGEHGDVGGERDGDGTSLDCDVDLLPTFG